MITVKADGWCGWRALAAQLYKNEDEYMVVKDLMLVTARAYSQIYKKYILYHSEQEYIRLITSMEYGLTPETKMEQKNFCPHKYWFDASTMAQVAADAFSRPVAVFETCNRSCSPPRFILPLAAPKVSTPAPLILHLVGGHYYSLVMKPSIRVEWPAVPAYHKQAWDEMEVPGHYKTTWRYYIEKRQNQPHKHITQIFSSDHHYSVHDQSPYKCTIE